MSLALTGKIAGLEEQINKQDKRISDLEATLLRLLEKLQEESEYKKTGRPPKHDGKRT